VLLQLTGAIFVSCVALLVFTYGLHASVTMVATFMYTASHTYILQWRLLTSDADKLVDLVELWLRC